MKKMVGAVQKAKAEEETTPRRFIRPRRAAHELDMSRTAIYDLINRGELKAVKIGRSLRIPAEEFEKYCGRVRRQLPA